MVINIISYDKLLSKTNINIFCSYDDIFMRLQAHNGMLCLSNCSLEYNQFLMNKIIYDIIKKIT